MLAPLTLAVPNTIGALSPAALSLIPLSQEGGVSVQLSSAATDSDGVKVYGSVLSAATLVAQCVELTNLAVAGRGPSALSQPTLYPYLYALRTGGTTTGLSLLVSGQETPGTAGAGGATLAYVDLATPISTTGNQFSTVVTAPSFVASTSLVTVTFTMTFLYAVNAAGTGAEFDFFVNGVDVAGGGTSVLAQGRTNFAMTRRVATTIGATTTIRVDWAALQGQPLSCAANNFDFAALLVTQ